MSSTRETNPNMTTLMQRFATLQVAVSMTQEELEDQLHAEVWRSDWQEVIRLLEAAKGAVSRKAANECAVLAVQKASVGEVSAILNLLPAGEYTECDTYLVDWSPTGETGRLFRWEVSVQGTLLMHAVAKNRPVVVRLLLNRGYDVNCASSISAAALIQDHYEAVSGYGRDFVPFHPYMARPENYVQLRKWDADPDGGEVLEWAGGTPLSLAIMLGHAECARMLVEHGAWLEEAPSVSAAMYLFWREKDADYQAAREVVLAAGDHTRHRPVLWAVGETCSPQQLKTVLEAWDYTQQELACAARRMVVSLRHQRDLWKTYTDGWDDLCRRIYRIGHICPEAIQDRSVIGELLDYFLSWKQVSIEPLLPMLGGATLDISEMQANLYCLDRPGAKKFFTELAEHCRLVMDRDAIDQGIPISVLRLLLQIVTFLPPAAEEGVSGLTQAILRTGDLRLIRKALQSGHIPPEESTEELLRCQQALRMPPICRSALLTTPRPKRRKSAVCPRYADMKCRWFADGERRKNLSILENPHWEQDFWFVMRNSFREQTVKAVGVEWQLHKTFFAACMEGRADIVERWLRYLPAEELRNIESMYCAEKDVMVVMSPLCAAALGGQTEIVELLLRHGALLQEDISGSPSVYAADWRSDDKVKRLSLNLTLAAALGGHWDTVKCLLDHGAAMDWTAEGNQLIWWQFHAEPLSETATYNLKGGRLHDVSK